MIRVIRITRKMRRQFDKLADRHDPAARIFISAEEFAKIYGPMKSPTFRGVIVAVRQEAAG